MKTNKGEFFNYHDPLPQEFKEFENIIKKCVHIDKS